MENMKVLPVRFSCDTKKRIDDISNDELFDKKIPVSIIARAAMNYGLELVAAGRDSMTKDEYINFLEGLQ